MIGALAAWFVVFAFYFSGLQEHHSQHVLYDDLRQGLAQETTPFGGSAIKDGTPVMLLDVPDIGLHATVVQGTSAADLSKGPGHYPASPFPGQPGISVLFGRSTTYGAPFGRITSLHTGAPIRVVTGQGPFTFRVTDVRQPGSPLPAPLRAAQSGITLVSSAGNGWHSGWSPGHVVYVDAVMAGGKVQAAPGGQPTAAPPSNAPMVGDTGHLVPLMLWLQGLLLFAGVSAYAFTRVGAWQLWLLALPPLLALLWGTTAAAMLLLPNLF